MAVAKKVKELLVITPNKVGMLAEVTGAIADSGVNITAICAYGSGGKASFMIVTEDNQKAQNALKAKKYEVKEKEVVAVNLSNKVGAAKDMAKRLAQAGVNLDYCYGSTGNGAEAMFIFSTKDITKALDVLK
jgi:hypothetical protein